MIEAAFTAMPQRPKNSAVLLGGENRATIARPADWLELMTTAVATTSYQGTVIRRKRGGSEALKVVHKIVVWRL